MNTVSEQNRMWKQKAAVEKIIPVSLYKHT